MDKEKILKKSLVVAGLAMICTFLWGSAFPCIKIGYTLFNIESSQTWSQVLFAGFRFLGAGLLTIIIGSLINKKLIKPSKKSIPKVIKLSTFQTILQYIFFYCGLARTTGVKSSIIEGANTFVAILISCLIFKYEKFNMKKLIGCILGFAGVVLVNVTSSGIDMNMKLTGEGFILLSVIAYGISSTMIKSYSKDENPVMLSGYQFIFGCLFMIIFSFIMGGRLITVSLEGILMLKYLAFVSGIAYTLWGILLKYNPISKVAVYGCMTPVFGVVLSAWWLQETGQDLGIKAIIALILVCLGILVVNSKNKEL